MTNKTLVKSFIERLRIVMTGCGFQSVQSVMNKADDELIVWDHDGKAFIMNVRRCAAFDDDLTA